MEARVTLRQCLVDAVQSVQHRQARRTIAGEAPAASRTLAMMSIDTKFVIH